MLITAQNGLILMIWSIKKESRTLQSIIKLRIPLLGLRMPMTLRKHSTMQIMFHSQHRQMPMALVFMELRNTRQVVEKSIVLI